MLFNVTDSESRLQNNLHEWDNDTSFSGHTSPRELCADTKNAILPAFYGTRKLLMQSNRRGLQLLVTCAVAPLKWKACHIQGDSLWYAFPYTESRAMCQIMLHHKCNMLLSVCSCVQVLVDCKSYECINVRILCL